MPDVGTTSVSSPAGCAGQPAGATDVSGTVVAFWTFASMPIDGIVRCVARMSRRTTTGVGMGAGVAVAGTAVGGDSVAVEATALLLLESLPEPQARTRAPSRA